MATHHRTRRHPAQSRPLTMIQVQISPEIKLPNTPNKVARNPRFKAKAIKEQIGGTNNAAKKSHQFTRRR
jgi:hypothetical protein